MLTRRCSRARRAQPGAAPDTTLHFPTRLLTPRLLAPLARLDVLLNALWPDLLAPLVAEIVPPYAQDVLNAYLQEREVLSIPDFITSLRIATFRFGEHCPYGTRAVRVGRPGVAANGDCVLELDIETLSSDMDITLHAGLNDLVAPLLEALHLRPEDSSYIAITVSDVRLVGTLRVRLCPGMRIAAAGFTEVPAVTLGLTLAYHNKLGFTRSLPVTALPGVEPTLRKLVQTEIAHYAVWPRFMAVDLVPPLLLGLPSAGEREPHGLLRVTLLQVKGVGLDALAKATAEAAASEVAHAQPRPVVPYAIIQWGLEAKRRRLPAAAAPLDGDGCTHWEAASPGGDLTGVSTDCDIFSVLGLDFFTVTLHAPGHGRLGAAQVKLQTMSTGETLFSFADTASDAYTSLPRVIFGAAQSDYQARFDPLLPGRSTAPGVSFGGALGTMQAWVPLDGQPGAAVHVRLEMDWRRSAQAAGAGDGGPRPFVGGLTTLLDSAQAQQASSQLLLHVCLGEVRGLPKFGTYTLVLSRGGDWRSGSRTRTIKGAAPLVDGSFELPMSRDVPTITLVLLRPAMHPGPSEVPLATAALPSTQLSPGVAASMLLHLTPLPAAPRDMIERVKSVQVLARAMLVAES